jgi:hypothetical protein
MKLNLDPTIPPRKPKPINLRFTLESNASKVRNGATETKCGRCQTVKPLTEFYTSKGSYSGYSSYCKKCSKEYDQSRVRVSVPKERKPRNNTTQFKWDCSYESLVEKFGSQCNICGRNSTEKRLCVDHDHDTGKIRGLLCRQCNSGIGMLQDKTELLEKAIWYLDRANTIC